MSLNHLVGLLGCAIHDGLVWCLMANAAARTRSRSPARLSVADVEQRAIPHQVAGYWYPTRREVPSTCPPFDPNGALLMDDSCTHALVLIELHGIWLPLSEAAEMIYSGPRSVAEGGEAFFVAFRDRDAQRSIYRVFDRALLKHQRVAEIYGDVAARRARTDKRSVQASISPQA